MIKKTLLLAAFTLPMLHSAFADEGMWMLTDLKKQNEVAMTELGLQISVDDIYNPNGVSL